MRVERVIPILAAAWLAACGTPPQERFFTLSSGVAPRTASASAATVAIAVGPVTVPEAVDRPQLVLRNGANRAEIVEQARWIAPLKNEIPRVIAEQLAGLIDGAQTSTNVQRAIGDADYRVLIDVQRFDSAPGEGATVQALWSVRPRNAAALEGRTVATESAGADYDSLVAAHSRALEKVSRDIAAAISAARANPPPP
jgi:uncharacterized lipoprotein YmbA